MEPETARTIGFALGMALMGYVALQVLTRGRKPPPSPVPSAGSGLEGGRKTLVILVVVAAVAGAIGYLVKK
jgi:hypothetical protein